MKLSMGLLAGAALALASTLVAAAAPFQGTYQANGKDAKLAFLTAHKGEPFSGKPVTILIFSEKDASKDKRPDFHAQMGDFGDALVVHLRQDGATWDVIGTEFAHAALKHSGASGTGLVNVKDVKVAGGELSGHLATSPGSDLFGEPLSVDLTFHVKQP
jgi:hypothetical protein